MRLLRVRLFNCLNVKNANNIAQTTICGCLPLNYCAVGSDGENLRIFSFLVLFVLVLELEESVDELLISKFCDQ